MHTRSLSKAIALLWLFACTLFVLPATAQPAPEVVITQPAPRGAGPGTLSLIAGTAKNAPADAHVVVYAFAGGTWWVQPYANQYLTPVRNGQWSTPTHLGGIYAAILVRGAWKAAPKLGALPAPGGDVLAVHQAAAR